MSDGTGIEISKRKMTILWDNDKMDAEVQMDAKDFPTFEAALAVIEVAKLKLQNMQRMAQINQMQQSQMQAMQNAAIAQQVSGKRLIH